MSPLTVQASSPPRRPPPVASGGGQTPIDLPTQTRLETLLRGRFRELLPFLPQRIVRESTVDTPQHTVLKECFGGGCYQYTLCGLSSDERRAAIAVLNRELGREGLDLRATEGGEMVLLNPLGTDKGTALRAFAQEIGIPASRILKFGDKAGPLGNDRPLLQDANSFNVGDQAADHRAVLNVEPSGPEGVLAVLDALERSGSPFQAIAADFDGTLNPGGTDRTAALDPRIAARWVDYAQRGIKVAIITGRGDSLFPHYLPPLWRAGLDPAAAKNLSIYLFNGARPTRPEEWPSATPLDLFEPEAPTHGRS